MPVKAVVQWFAILMLTAWGLCGCIRTRVIVTSDPPGADVTLNGIHRGKTPIEIPFIWYWYYDFELRQEGYEPLWVRERFHAPVYFYMPLDAVAEALPMPIYDTKRRHYVMVTRPEREPVTPGIGLQPAPVKTR